MNELDIPEQPEQPAPPMDHPDLEGINPMCPICGCAPVDFELHNQWHEELSHE